MAESSTAPRPTPAIPTGGLFSPFAEVTVSAPPSAVYDALIDTSKWGEWNNFVPSVTITKHPSSIPKSSDARMTKDMFMTFKVNMSSSVSTVSKEIVTQVDEPPTASHLKNITRVCWVMNNSGMLTPKFLLSAERVNEIEDLGDGTCIYRSWETFAGPFARIVKWKYEQTLETNFQKWATGLQQYVEAKEKQARDKEAAVELPA